MTDHGAYAAAAAYDLRNPDSTWLMLLLHGLGGDRQQALGLVDGVDDPRLAVLAPDLRAHGETPLVGPPEAFAFDALVADVVALLDRTGQGNKPTIVVGISMGAALALRMALAPRVDLRGLVLVRPAFDDTPSPPNLAVMPVVARLLQEEGVERARALLLASAEYGAIAEVTSLGARSVEDQLTKPLAQDRALRLAEVPKNVAWRDAAELSAITVPAVVVGSDRDVMHPLALARRTADLLPGGRLVEVTPRDVDSVRYDREIRTAIQTQVVELLGASR